VTTGILIDRPVTFDQAKTTRLMRCMMLRVMVVGLGPIGASCARTIRREAGIELTGMLDIDPAKQGKLAAELGCEDEKPLRPDNPGPRVTDDLDEAIGQGVDVAVVTTTSSFEGITPMLRTLIERKISVVSSCEEMAWPRYRNAALADAIDAQAKAAGVALLGTGVNPGFVMDAFAVMLASMVRRVAKVRCTRRVNAALRRKPLQEKVGANMTVDRFRDLAKKGKIGHKGLAESIALLAAGLNRNVEPGSVSETLEPVIAEQPLDSAMGLIQPGLVCGMQNVGVWKGDGLEIELDLIMAVGQKDPKDKVYLQGPVEINLVIPGSLPGDSATVAALVNQIPNVHRAAPGLHTMLTLPPAGCLNRSI